MKLVIQIPCYNEADTLPQTLRDIPQELPGIDEIEILVIDDGSTDDTARVARENGVDHVMSFTHNRGLAAAFQAGLNRALELGADMIVNTDGDNQYQGRCIPALIDPIVRGEADMVIGARPIEAMEDFSYTKKKLQRLGSWIVSRFAGISIPDTTSGFRALSREAALKINVVSDYTYTLETIIQASKKGLTIACVPVGTNRKLRESRLMKNMASFIARSAATVLRIYLMYKPLKFFMSLGIALFAVGAATGARYLYFYFGPGGQGHIQSLILAAILMILGFQIATLGLIGNIVDANRKFLEDILYQLKKGGRTDGSHILGSIRQEAEAQNPDRRVEG